MDAKEKTVYENPLVKRYASKEMLEIFSPRHKFLTWRDLWIQLAQAQHELGLNVSEEQVEDLKNTRDDLDLERAFELEREIRHDVMAHILAWGEKAKKAGGIIHLGATSAFVTDNTELLQMKQGLHLLRLKVVKVISVLSEFADKWKNLPCLGYTHFQPSQPTTLGKRACLWVQDFLIDHEVLGLASSLLKARGVKGTTGTQASYMQLFDGDSERVRELDRRVTKRIGFSESFPVTGQTYPRKIDYLVLSSIAGIAASCAKFANDIRLLCHEGELEEPFEERQVGSSAMAHKRNPMRCERIVSISRFVLSLPLNAGFTASDQWLERTLDDSANRRITIPEAFLGADACLGLVANVGKGLTVFPERIKKNLEKELQFLIAETVIMEGVKQGKDRQKLHEKLRRITVNAGKALKEGKNVDVLSKIAEEKYFGVSIQWLRERVKPEYLVGRAPEQVDDFLNEFVKPLIQRYEAELKATKEDDVKV